MSADGPGTLWVVATPIGNLEDVSERTRRVLAEADLIAAEDTRRTGRLLQHLGIERPLTSFHEHNEVRRAPELVERLAAGESVALVTDAGVPGISDPGYRLVAAARDAHVPVFAVPGPSAVVTAVAVAGLPAPTFTFYGFVPRKAGDRRRLAEEIAASRHAAVFFESARRLPSTLAALGEALGDRTVAVCRELTKVHEEVIRGSAAEVAATLENRDSIKGEVTVVVAATSSPTRRVETPDPDALLAEGLSLKEVAARLAEATGRAKREIYAELVARKELKSQGK